MSFKPSILTRWISHPAEILQRSTIRAAPSTPAFPILRRQPFLAHQIASKTTRRSLTTTTRRVTAAPRPGVRSIPLPKQRLNRRFNSGSSNGGSQAKEGNSLSQRLRKLSREYGWAAVGVYMALSALDFPFCFVAVRLLGVERIGHFEHVVIESVKETFKTVWPQAASPSMSESEDGEAGQGSLVRAEERNQEEASKSPPPGLDD